MLTKQTLASIVLPMLSLTSACAGAVPKTNPYQFKRFTSENPAFTLFKPETWRVQHASSADAFRIVVADAGATSVVEIYFAVNRGRFDPLGVLGAKVKELNARYPDLRLSAVVECKDKSCAAATMTYTRDKVAVEGRFYFQADPQQIVIRSYSAPASRLAADRNLLLDILANIRVGGPQAQRTESRVAPAPPPPPPPVQVQLVPRQAPDGSLSIHLPADWTFQALKGRILAVDPRGGCGFIFTTFDIMSSNFGLRQLPPDVIVSPYRPPAQIIVPIFQKFGNSDIRIVNATVNPQTRMECQCDTADLTLSWMSPKGVASMGSFTVRNSRPGGITGNWFAMVSGTWGPAQELGRYLPMLEQIGASFSINDRYAKNYIQQGLASLRVQQQRTARAMQSLNDARADNQRDWEARQERKDASDAKWDDYRRGNTYWISDLEGGKVYQTDPWGTQDTWTGDRVDGQPYGYVHFEGQNPRHSSEQMRELSSYEVKKLGQ